MSCVEQVDSRAFSSPVGLPAAIQDGGFEWDLARSAL